MRLIGFITILVMSAGWHEGRVLELRIRWTMTQSMMKEKTISPKDCHEKDQSDCLLPMLTSLRTMTQTKMVTGPKVHRTELNYGTGAISSPITINGLPPHRGFQLTPPTPGVAGMPGAFAGAVGGGWDWEGLCCCWGAALLSAAVAAAAAALLVLLLLLLRLVPLRALRLLLAAISCAATIAAAVSLSWGTGQPEAAHTIWQLPPCLPSYDDSYGAPGDPKATCEPITMWRQSATITMMITFVSAHYGCGYTLMQRHSAMNAMRMLCGPI